MRALKQDSEYMQDLMLYADEAFRMAIQQNKTIAVRAMPQSECTDKAFLDIQLGDEHSHRWEGAHGTEHDHLHKGQIRTAC